MVNNEAVETLTQYRYDEHGQLSTVINRNGDTVRSFSSADGVMAKHPLKYPATYSSNATA